MNQLSVVIPVYNEEHTIHRILDLVNGVSPSGVTLEIIIVNDGSTDGTSDQVRDWIQAHENTPERSYQLKEKANGGKGSAVREGISCSHGNLVIVQDADLEYDPKDYAACIAPILNGSAQVVYGSREDANRNRLYSSPCFYLGGLLLTFWMDLLFHAQMTDEPTCYKTFDGDLIRSLPFDGDHFDWEPEVTAKLLRLGIPIHEVSVSYYPRSLSEGKKIRWQDGIQGLWVALKWRFAPMKKIAETVAGISETYEKLECSARYSRIALLLVIGIALILRGIFLQSGATDPRLSVMWYPVRFLTEYASPSWMPSWQVPLLDVGIYQLFERILPFVQAPWWWIQVCSAGIAVIPFYLTIRMLSSWRLAYIGTLLLLFVTLDHVQMLTLAALFGSFYFLLRFLRTDFGLFLVTSGGLVGIASWNEPGCLLFLFPLGVSVLGDRALPWHLRFNYFLFALLACGAVFLPAYLVSGVIEQEMVFHRETSLLMAVVHPLSSMLAVPFLLYVLYVLSNHRDAWNRVTAGIFFMVLAGCFFYNVFQPMLLLSCFCLLALATCPQLVKNAAAWK